MSRWKQGDTLPNMVIECYDGTGARPNLSLASEVRVLAYKSGVLVWQRVLAGGADGTVTVVLQPTDTATAGTYKIKVRVTWPDGKRQHYPPEDKFLTMTVTP